jgi:hypothetical protein
MNDGWHFQLITEKGSEHVAMHIAVAGKDGNFTYSGRPAWIEGRNIGEVKNLLRKMMADIDKYGTVEIEGEHNED